MPRCSLSVLAVLVAVLLTGAPRALAQDLACQKAIGVQSRTFVRTDLKLLERCRAQDLANPDRCPAPDAERRARLAERLGAKLAAKCAGVVLENLGFPDECSDPNGAPFTVEELHDCITDTHTAESEALAAIEGDPSITPGAFDGATLKCQRTIFAAGLEFFDAALQSLQRCRDAVLAGDITVEPPVCGVLSPVVCTSDPSVVAAIAKAREKAVTLILKKCSDAQMGALEVCEPDQATAAHAAACVLDAKHEAAERLTAIEYPTADPPGCGDGVVNCAREECDGADDDACPGECGAANGFFECLCLDEKRERVVEHDTADLDIGWKGPSHDSKIVGGGGYVSDLWDCDGPGGPDTVCNVGPSCSLAPHSPCRGTKNGVAANVGPPYENGDAICAGLGQGTCRKTLRGATGPHCELDFQQECDTNAQCPGVGDRCVETMHGAPLPLSAGAVEVCIQNYFTEDVVGTTDLATGQGRIRMRQVSRTFLGGHSAEPCPICGGFCAGDPNPAAPEARLPCTVDADCTTPPFRCVTDFVCSYGERQDQPCRPYAPFGGATTLFGTPSQDCPVRAGAVPIGQPDILFDPLRTGPIVFPAPLPCLTGGFNAKVCVAGSNDGRACTVGSECPGGACANQCHCPGQLLPSICEPACRGGSNDAVACGGDSECPGGFCHPADCRVNPSDTDSVQEGVCTSGPVDRLCSITKYQGCDEDADCQPSPECPRCQNGETCEVSFRQCFVNPIQRTGAPGMPDRVAAALFCIPATSPTVDGVVGLPGPGALTQPITSLYSGF